MKEKRISHVVGKGSLSHNNRCFFATLANNGWSYMPTKESYLPGLYESLFGSAKFYPEDTEAIFDRFIELGLELIEK